MGAFMSSPPVHYVRTSDGYRIAYMKSGDGVPLVQMPLPINHLTLMWQADNRRKLFEGLSQRFRLVQYDSRGEGMSDRGLSEMLRSEDFEQDLESVIDAAGLERFLLFAPNGSNHVAVRYAIRHPDRLYGLILWQLIGNWQGTEIGFMANIAADDWHRCLVMAAQVFLAGEDFDVGLRIMSESTQQTDFLTRALADDASNVEQLLPDLRVPVLLLYKGIAFRRTLDWARKMAASIPQAQLVLLDDDGDLYGYPRDSHQLLTAIDGFVRSLGIDTGAREDVLRRQPADSTHPLTRRELEVLRLLATGSTNAEMAAQMVISDRTVARHITNIYAKINARSKVEATAYAFRHGLT